jgi:energy-coupling factor transport system permease protein
MILPAIFLALDIFTITLTFLFLIIVFRLSKVGARSWIASVRRFRWMLLITFAMNYAARSDGIFDEQALVASLIVTLHILGAIMAALLITSTTTPWDLSRGLTDVLKPLSWVSVPVREFGLTMALAIRFVPMFHLEIRNIIMAQQARGVDWSQRNLVAKANGLASILAPALNSAVRRSDNLSTAIKCRGYPSSLDTVDEATNLTPSELIALFSSLLIFTTNYFIFHVHS